MHWAVSSISSSGNAEGCTVQKATANLLQGSHDDNQLRTCLVLMCSQKQTAGDTCLNVLWNWQLFMQRFVYMKVTFSFLLLCALPAQLLPAFVSLQSIWSLNQAADIHQLHAGLDSNQKEHVYSSSAVNAMVSALMVTHHALICAENDCEEPSCNQDLRDLLDHVDNCSGCTLQE